MVHLGLSEESPSRCPASGSKSARYFKFAKALFLVGAVINKRARLLQSLVFLKKQTRSDEIFVQFVQLNEYLGNASKLLQRVPFHFSLERLLKNFSMLQKGPFFGISKVHTKSFESKRSDLFRIVRLYSSI